MNWVLSCLDCFLQVVVGNDFRIRKVLFGNCRGNEILGSEKKNNSRGRLIYEFRDEYSDGECAKARRSATFLSRLECVEGATVSDEHLRT